MKQVSFEMLSNAETAMAYSNQAVAVLDMWLDSLSNNGDDTEANRVAAVHSLVHQALEHLQKAVEVRNA